MQKGRYKLICENLLDSSCEVFDFSNEIKDFVPVEEDVVPVSVATIDAFTSLFPSGEYLGAYLGKKSSIDREEKEKQYYISYPQKFTKESVRLNTVWDDPILNEIASHAKGGKVDFDNPTTKETFVNMIRLVYDKKVNFCSSLLVSSSNDFRLNDYTRNLLKKCAFQTSPHETLLDFKIKETFSNYREYRALYLSYKRYLQKLEKNKGQSLSK